MPKPDDLNAARDAITRLRECCAEIRGRMSTVLVGQQEPLELLMMGLFSGGHVLVIGVPGLAKTMMVKALSELLG